MKITKTLDISSFLLVENMLVDKVDVRKYINETTEIVRNNVNNFVRLQGLGFIDYQLQFSLNNPFSNYSEIIVRILNNDFLIESDCIQHQLKLINSGNLI